jgi:probable RNA-binding protein EIF1AD
MSGLGRRTHYRKHLTDSVLNDLPEPTNSNQRIAKILGTRGSNQFEIIVAPPTVLSVSQVSNHGGNSKNSEQETQEQNPPPEEELDMTPQLSILPTKYRKLIWLKRNDYVMIECAEEEEETQTQAQIQNDDNNGNDDNNNNNNDNNDNSNGKKSTNTNNIDGGIRYMITHILYKDQIKHLKEKNMWPVHSFFSDKNMSSIDKAEEEENEIQLIERAKALMKKNAACQDGDGNGDGDGSGNGNHDEGEQEEDGYDYDEGYDYDDEDGIVFSNDNDYFVNTNRIARIKIDDSSSDEDSD